MKVKLALTIFLLLNLKLVAGNDINKLRSLYHTAIHNEQSAEMLVKMSGLNDALNSPLFLGYKGMGYLLLAKHAFNPLDKWRNFRKGKALLESAIRSDNKSVELRYLRLTIQTNVPHFLNYNKNIESDRNYIINNITAIDNLNLRSEIAIYLKEKKLCGGKEEAQWNLNLYKYSSASRK